VSQRVTTVAGGRVITACARRVIATRAGGLTVSCHLWPRARRLLAADLLRLRIRTTFTPSRGAARTVVTTLTARRDTS